MTLGCAAGVLSDKWGFTGITSGCDMISGGHQLPPLSTIQMNISILPALSGKKCCLGN